MSTESAGADYLRSVIEVARALFSPQEAAGLGAQLPTTISARASGPFRFLRLQLEDENALHLHSVQLFGEHGPIDLGTATLALSSTYPNTEKLLEARTFFRQTSSVYGFHTLREKQPWALIDLLDVQDVRDIVVRNRTDRYSERANKLVISTSVDGELWTQVFRYDADESRRRAADLMPFFMQRGMRDGVSEAYKIAQIGLLTYAADYNSAQKFFETLRLPASERSAICFAANDTILAERKLEWTNHGVKRTFRYWSDEEKTKYLDFCRGLVGLLTDAGYPACIGYGGALAFVRDRALIPHDDDLDVIVLVKRSDYPNMQAALGTVRAFLEGHGHRTGGDFASHFHVPGPRTVDCFVGFEDEGKASWFPGPRNIFDVEDIFPPLECDFLGSRIAIPRNPFKYVAEVYGPEWMFPKPRWNHKWDKSDYADWFS